MTVRADIPGRGTPRLEWIRALDSAVAADVLAFGDWLVEQGLAHDEVRQVQDAFAVYLSAHITDAAAMAADLWAETR